MPDAIIDSIVTGANLGDKLPIGGLTLLKRMMLTWHQQVVNGELFPLAAAKLFIDPRVQAKISLNGEKDPVALLDLYHPS